MGTHPPPLADLLGRFGIDSATGVERAQLPLTTINGEAGRILAYLRGFGWRISSAADVLRAVTALEDEEELSAFAVLEGVALTHASDGWWVLLTD